MVSCFISRLVILVFGTLYPAYASYKAVRTKNVKEYVKWMMYWIVFALFTCAETFTDVFLSFWFPFYYEIKIITVIYLLSPATKGSSMLYRKFVHPALIKKEQDIDEYIAKAKEQGYHTMLNLGSKGVNYATSLIMQTAIKGGGGLVNQLRRSYSLSDLSEEQSLRQIKEGDVSDGYDEDPRLIRRKLVQSPRKITSADQAGLYFPEIEINQGLEDEITYRQIPSYEQMSSGYSSGDPFYYDAERPKNENLVRTASLGPSTRVRTRATTKYGLPKRAGLSEGGSTWSALESHESQFETEKRFSIPLSHSASLPVSFPSLQHFVIPHYQYMFGNMSQNQLLTLINHSQYSQFINNKANDVENKPEEVLNDDASKNLNSGVIISEENSDNSQDQTVEKVSSLKSCDSVINDVKNDDTDNAAQEEGNEISNLENEAEKKNIDTIALPSDNKDCKEKPPQEKLGKYKKKPAPSPPTEDSDSKITSHLKVEDEETEFFTPNSSPKTSRKQSSSLSDLQSEKNITDHEVVKHEKNNTPEVSKKSKSKTKNLQKKLHIPKMSFSFWHQKGGKESSVSETSSIASVEITTAKSESKDEYYISLKDADDEKENTIKDETVSAYATLPKVRKGGRKKL